MSINLNTIISAFDDKLTLMQWLKKLEQTMHDKALKSIQVVNVGNDAVKLVFTLA